MAQVAEKEVTVSEVNDQLKTSREKLTTARNLFGALYDNIVPLQERGRPEVLKAVSDSGSKMDTLFDTEVRFPQPPDILTPKTFDRLKGFDLTLMTVPAFLIHDPVELERIVTEDKKPSPVTKVFPMQYLRGVLAGEVPYPHKTGYHMAIDTPEPKTQLSGVLGIKDLHKASIQDVERVIHEKGDDVLQYRFDLDPEKAYIRVVTAKELLLQRAIEQAEEERVTATRLHTTHEHVVFEGDDMLARDRRERGIPPRLAIVLSSRPHTVRYLRGRAR